MADFFDIEVVFKSLVSEGDRLREGLEDEGAKAFIATSDEVRLQEEKVVLVEPG